MVKVWRWARSALNYVRYVSIPRSVPFTGPDDDEVRRVEGAASKHDTSVVPAAMRLSTPAIERCHVHVVSFGWRLAEC